MNNKFRFWIPLDKITKSQDKKGNPVMMFGGMASTNRRDTDGESLDPSNFDVDYLKEKGVVNWNHCKNPEAVIGEPTKVEKRKDGLYVESMLYPDNALAKSVWELAETLEKNSKTRRLGYSVEGKATERDPLDKTRVTKAMITNIALTISPKNPDSIVDIIKGNFHELEQSSMDISKSIDEMIEDIHDEIEKGDLDAIDGNLQENRNGGANGKESHDKIVDIVRPDGVRIMVDHNYCVTIDKALDTVNGAALRKEHVDKNLKDLQKSTDEELMQDILKSDSVISFEQADLIYNNIQQKLNTMAIAKKSEKTSNRDLINKALEELGADNLSKSEKEDTSEQDDLDEAELNKAVDDGEDDVKKGEDEDDESEEEGDAPEEDDEEEEVKKPAKKAAKKAKKTDDEDEDDAVSDDKMYNNMEKALTSKMDAQGKTFGVLFKGLFEEIKAGQAELIKSIQEEVLDLKEEIAKSNELIEELSNAPLPKKSVTRAIDKTFEKAVDNDELSGRGKQPNKLSKSQVLNALDKLTFEKGFNEEISKSLLSYETTGTLNAKVQAMVEELTGGKL